MSKFWILFLTLTKYDSKLENGLADLAFYGVENTCDNRILMADFLSKDIDQQEVQAD
jgi:hypothetical protein